MFRAAAPAVDILDPQQERAAAGAGEIVRKERRIGMAEMKAPGGARREAGDGVFHLART
jgi:hypothetical protein